MVVCSNCEVLLRQMDRDKHRIKELDEESHRLSKLLIEARMRMVELKEGIEDFLARCHGEDHGIPEWVMDVLKKLVEKE